jgi:hypothetical protein
MLQTILNLVNYCDKCYLTDLKSQKFLLEMYLFSISDRRHFVFILQNKTCKHFNIILHVMSWKKQNGGDLKRWKDFLKLLHTYKRTNWANSWFLTVRESTNVKAQSSLRFLFVLYIFLLFWDPKTSETFKYLFFKSFIKTFFRII